MVLLWKLLFIGVLVCVIYCYVGYPVVLAVAGLFKKRRPAQESDRHPSVALIISAYNEERIIGEKIENTLKLDYPRNMLKIIIASDGSIDATDRIVREYDDRGVVLKAFDKREGKSSTLNKSILGLEEEIVIFSDANAFYREDAVIKLVHGFRDPNVGCVIGRLIYLDNHSYVGTGEGLYWRYESSLNRLESKLGSVLTGTGTIFAIRRELFRPVIKDVANDLQLPAEVAAQGYDVVYERDAVAYEQSTHLCREEFSRKWRIIVRGLTGFRHLKGDFGGAFRTFQFLSRKMLRWLIGPMLPLLYVSNLALIGEPVFFICFLLQNLFYLFALVGALLRKGVVRSKIFLVPFYFVVVNAAALVAIVTYVAGRRLSSWEKAETTRDFEDETLREPRLLVIPGKKPSFEKVNKELENLERIT
jgi:biofilm PGA synthesis N-glycosyltransferase PgaC